MIATLQRRPAWLKVKLPGGAGYTETKRIAREMNLHTICEDARCPNIAECWGRKTATFMILGDICTRNCAFCSVKSGRPQELDLDEPKRTAYAVKSLGILHAVITSVDRDDLKDGGAFIFANTIIEIRRQSPQTTIEVLTPDFRGDIEALKIVLGAQPDVFAHNVETIPRLYKKVRAGHSYQRSFGILAMAKEIMPNVKTKTGFMLGHGETLEDVYKLMDDVVANKIDMLTISQYLQPTKENLPVEKFYTPDEFAKFKAIATNKGIKFVQSGPLVRSSYKAEEIFAEAQSSEKLHFGD